MLLSNKITFLRILLSPVFFILYMLPEFFPDLFEKQAGAGILSGAGWTVPLLWLIYVGAQMTDMFDGMVARKRNETSDFGKLFDPFADTFLQITCFLCFVLEGIFPPVLFLLVLYREFSILLVRNMMMKKGVAMGARIGGKVKTVTYILAGGAALFAVSFQRLGFLEILYPWFRYGSVVLFIISVIFSIISFFDYLSVYRKT